MLPHAIAADPRLTAVDVRVITALLYFAKARTVCTPCDKSIAARAGGVAVGTVQRSLRHLEQTGYLQRRAVEPSDQNRTGRVIHLLWRSEDTAAADRPPERRRAASRSPVTDNSELQEAQNRNVPKFAPGHSDTTNRPALLSAPDKPPPGVPESPDKPPRPIPEELKSLPGADAATVRRLAARIANHLSDVRSLGYYISVLAQIVAGAAPVARALAAYQAADRARGNARKPGAIFCVTWAAWLPPPKPPEIRYHQVRRDQAPSEPGLGREDEIAQLREWLANRRHPCHRYAQRRLAELEALAPPCPGG